MKEQRPPINTERERRKPLKNRFKIKISARTPKDRRRLEREPKSLLPTPPAIFRTADGTSDKPKDLTNQKEKGKNHYLSSNLHTST